MTSFRLSQRIAFSFLVFAVPVFLVCSVVIFAADPGATATNPVGVGVAGSSKDTPPKPKSPTAFRGNTNGPGALGFDVKNSSEKTARDFHLRIVFPPGAKISDIAMDPPWVVNTSSGESVDAKIPAGTAGAAPDSVHPVDIEVEDKDGNPLSNTEVKLEAWWTRGINNNIIICATSPDSIGDGDPVATIASLSIPGYSATTPSVPETTPSVMLNPLVLAERDGYRFDNGDIVVNPSGNAVFAIELDQTTVEAYDQNGDLVTSQTRVSFSDLRIDSRGNLVFSMTRNPDDKLHLVIMIRGAKLSSLSGESRSSTVTASVSGSAVSGHLLEDIWNLIDITAP